jgi:hypothetical protein
MTKRDISMPFQTYRRRKCNHQNCWYRPVVCSIDECLVAENMPMSWIGLLFATVGFLPALSVLQFSLAFSLFRPLFRQQYDCLTSYNIPPPLHMRCPVHHHKQWFPMSSPSNSDGKKRRGRPPRNKESAASSVVSV